jgi:hypothetical protein
MTIKDLKAFIADMPDDMPVLIPNMDEESTDTFWCYPPCRSLLVTNVCRVNSCEYQAQKRAGKDTIRGLILTDERYCR